jgi:hypothetical protein
MERYGPEALSPNDRGSSVSGEQFHFAAPTGAGLLDCFKPQVEADVREERRWAVQPGPDLVLGQ